MHIKRIPLQICKQTYIHIHILYILVKFDTLNTRKYFVTENI